MTSLNTTQIPFYIQVQITRPHYPLSFKRIRAFADVQSDCYDLWAAAAKNHLLKCRLSISLRDISRRYAPGEIQIEILNKYGMDRKFRQDRFSNTVPTERLHACDLCNHHARQHILRASFHSLHTENREKVTRSDRK